MRIFGLAAAAAGAAAACSSDGAVSSPSTEAAEPVPAPSVTVLVADRSNNRIRAISPAGMVTTFTGSDYGYRDGPATQAQFRFPFGVAVGADRSVYVSDQGSHRIRRIDPDRDVRSIAGGTVGFADGTGEAARFDQPYGLTVDALGNVYVADTFNHRIRVISADGAVTTLAGGDKGYADGVGPDARFDEPSGLALSPDGTLYVADRANHRLRMVTPDGEVTTLAGASAGYADGIRTEVRLNRPTALAIDAAGDLVVADLANHRIRVVDRVGAATTLAGSTEGYADGPGPAAQFRAPCGVAIDPSGLIVVADRENHRIRLVTPQGQVSTLAGHDYGFRDGPARTALFDLPYSVAVGPL